ncbi:hypothetical protein, partial [Burkholderia ubonensis]|uniref:hypothetical protein n=1 Tax=Burkholderia ubonensis TaxID=101571 RepID=UPI0012F98E2D
MSEGEYQKQMKVIRELQIPDLDFLFYGDPLERYEVAPQENGPTIHQTGEAAAASNAANLIATPESSRAKRSVRVSSESIPQFIRGAVEEAGLNNNNIVGMLLDGVNNLPDVRNLSGRPHAERNVMVLLKFIQAISHFIESQGREDQERYRVLLDGLWRIADELSDLYGQSKVAEYKRAFLIRNESGRSVQANGGSPAVEPSMSQGRLAQDIEGFGEHVLQQLEAFYSPILNPSAFIDEYIKEGVRRYEERTGKTLSLGPDSPVTVRITTQVVNENFGRSGPGGREKFIRQVAGIRTYPLKEIVTGHYLYDLTAVAKGNTTREVIFDNRDAENLVNAFNGVDLQTKMEQALSKYRNDPAKRSGLTSHYQNVIKLRCMEYLNNPNKVPAYQQAVVKFLTGEIQ